MAIFTNKATLSYSGGTVDSNTVTGELLEVLSITKTAVTDDYTAKDDVTYVVVLRNTGTAPLAGITVTDDLGAYEFGTAPDTVTLYPLTYTDGSVKYYVNGILQVSPAVTAGAPLVFSGITVPAGGSVMLIYEATVNNFAPLSAGSSITNTVTAAGGGLSSAVTASETVFTEDRADLTISKSVCPPTVTENGQLTYTFVIENIGNTAAVATDDIVITDTFNPILDPITVTLDGAVLTEGVDYTYDPATGVFATTAGRVTVPAAAYTQNPDGTWTVTPGIAALTVTGTV